MKTKEYREQLAEAFLHVLEERQLDWKKGWSGIGGIPVNGRSGHQYRGINRFFLMLTAAKRGYRDHRWCTFNQIRDKGWKLVDAKGQGVQVEYWFPFDRKEKKGMSWEAFRLTGEKLGERYVLRASYKTVFNADLIEGIPELPVPEKKDISQDILIGRLSKNMEVEILHDGGNRAFYNVGEDRIHLPLAESFDSEYAYGSTALHELSHATGAAHRLNRDMGNGFGSPGYAYEELVAEITASFLSANLQTEQTEQHIENHKAYVQSWAKAIRKDPEKLVKAVQQAERTAAYMEYKAELIEQKDYEKIIGASMDAAGSVLDEKQEEGLGIQNKPREELQEMVQSIRADLQEIQEDTKFLKGFAGRNGIPLPEQGRDYYVIDDKQTGRTVTDPSGKERHFDSKEAADQAAAALAGEEQTPKMAQDLIKEYERSIGREESVLKKYTDEQLISYAGMCQRYLEFGRMVDRVLDRRDLPMREAVKVCETPELFVEAGFQRYPMHITQKHLRNCTHEKTSGDKRYHGLTREEIKRIPEALEDPALVAGSLTREDSVVAVLGYREREGLPVMVSIVPGGEAAYQLETVDSNFITSAYGRTNAGDLVRRMVEGGHLIYIDKEKSEELALLPLQLRQDHPDLAYNRIIKQLGEDVNGLAAEKAKASDGSAQDIALAAKSIRKRDGEGIQPLHRR